MIKRTRLLSRIADSNQKWWIEAGAGFGKTTLLEQLQSESTSPLLLLRLQVGADRAAFCAQLSIAASAQGLAGFDRLSNGTAPSGQIATALASCGASVAVDDILHGDDDLLAFLIDLGSAVGGRTTLVLAGRSHGLTPTGWQHVSSQELAFTLEETQQAIAGSAELDNAVVADLYRLTAGWPPAVESVRARMVGRDPLVIAGTVARSESVVDDLFTPCLAGIDETDGNFAAVLAALPFFDEGLFGVLGNAGALERLTTAGLPVYPGLDGWLEIPAPFRASLQRLDQSSELLARAVVDYFVDRGEVLAALTLCVGSGQRSMAARVLASLSSDQESRLDPDALLPIMTAIGDAATVAPRCLYIHAHICAVHGRTVEGLQYIERAAVLFAQQDPDLADAHHMETLLTLGVWRVFDGDLAESESILRRCEAVLDTDEQPRLAAQLFDLRGLLHHAQGSEQDLELATYEMGEALATWRRLQEPEAAAVTLFRLASGVLATRGRPAEAIALLDTLPDFGPMSLLNTARLGLEKALLLPYLGRSDEVPALLAETRRIATLLSDDWLYLWALTTEIIADSYNDKSVEMEALADEAANYLTFSEVSEGLVWCDVAEAFARCGLLDRASAALAAVQKIAGMDDWSVDYAEASIEARLVDPERALVLLDQLELRPKAATYMRWQIALLQSYAHWRLGNTNESEKQLDQAYAEARRISQPTLPMVIEKKLVEQVRSGPSQAGLEQAGSTPLRLTLFGSFELSNGHEPLDVPRGRASTLLKMLALADGALVVDQVVDAMWPDADLEVGRRRIRNVVLRVREACGEVVVRDGDTIRLGREVTSDFQTARQLASAALDSGRTLVMITAALEHLDHELLPSDRYEDWAELARNEHQRLRIRLLDEQAALAEAAGDHRLAAVALERAHDLDPFDRDRLQRAIRILRAAGLDAAASAIERRFD